MPSPALDKIQLLTADGLDQSTSKYNGRWIVHVPGVVAPGDGLINELDWTIELPGFPGLIIGFWIGNDSDGDPSRFGSDQVLDTDALPSWVTYFGNTITTPVFWNEPLSIVTWDGGWNVHATTPETFITLDDVNSDPDWEDWHGPHISSVTPGSGAAGDTVVLTGAGFTGALNLIIGTYVSFTVDSDTQITATLAPFGGGQTSIQLQLAGGGWIQPFQRFDFDGPIVTSLSPSHGRPGNVLKIFGTELGVANVVQFNGSPTTVNVTPTFVSATEVHAIVPAVAAGHYTMYVGFGSGPTAQDATGTPGFDIDRPPPPTITSVSPDHGITGDLVTVRGTNLAGATLVEFSSSDYGRSAGSGLTVISDTELTVHAPLYVITGVITVTTPSGIGSTLRPWVLEIPPVISGVSPDPTRPGCGVTLSGTGLSYVYSVQVDPGSGGISVPFSIVSDTELRLELPIAVSPQMTISITNEAGFVQAYQPAVYDLAADDYLYPRLVSPSSGDNAVLMTNWVVGIAAPSVLKLSDHGAGADQGVFLVYGCRQIAGSVYPDTYEAAIQLLVYGIGAVAQEALTVWTEAVHGNTTFLVLACAIPGTNLILVRPSGMGVGYQVCSWTSSGYHLATVGAMVGGGEAGGPFTNLVSLGTTKAFALGSDTAFRDHEVLNVSMSGVTVAATGLFTDSYFKAWPIDDDHVLLMGVSEAAPTAYYLVVYRASTDSLGTEFDPIVVDSDGHVSVSFVDASHFYALAEWSAHDLILGYYSISGMTITTEWTRRLSDSGFTQDYDPQGSRVVPSLMDVVSSAGGGSRPGPFLVPSGLSNLGSTSRPLVWAVDPAQTEAADVSHHLGFGPGEFLVGADGIGLEIDSTAPKADGRLVCVSSHPNPTPGDLNIIKAFLIEIAAGALTCVPYVPAPRQIGQSVVTGQNSRVRRLARFS